MADSDSDKEREGRCGGTRDSAAAPAHEHLRETPVASEGVFDGRFLRVWRDTVRLPDGALAHREYIKHSGAVMVVPLLDNGRVLMERQWRTPMRRVMTEFPAGKLDPGESWLACAARELREETGYVAREWAYIGGINNAISYSDEIIHLAFARGLSPGPRQLDQHEFLEVFEAEPRELLEWVRTGAITDVKTVIGVFWLEKLLAGNWPLHWHGEG